MIKLVAIDLDDTLINNQLEISAANQEAIARVRNQGVIVTICTGRMHVAAMPFVSQLNLPADQVLISYNGALLKQVNGDLLEHVALERETALEIIRYCQEKALTLNCYYNDRLYVSKINDFVNYYTGIIKVEAIAVGDLEQFIINEDADLSKMLIVAEEELVTTELQHMENVYANRAQITRSKPRYIEITNLKASKGQALSRLASRLGFAASEVMAIGDGGNDLSMVEWAGLGVAVGNATPAVKAAADYVAKSNERSGVADALNKYIL